MCPSCRWTRNKGLYFREWLDLRYFVGVTFYDLPESNPCEMLFFNIVNIASDKSNLCKKCFFVPFAFHQ